MKILFYGDSITDAGRVRDKVGTNDSLGYGYVRDISSMLLAESLDAPEIINTGISGNRVVDLYARIKSDFWNHEPDVVSILIGINDIWHEVAMNNGVEIDRFENIYRIMLSETKKRFPNMKIILCEPFVLSGSATEESYERFLEVYDYAKIVKGLAAEFGATFIELQESITAAGKACGNSEILFDGVHPTSKGAVVIAKEWMKAYGEISKKFVK